MATDKPLVSVEISAYNDADNLPIAINAALNQTMRHLEVIVVDDCSTDNTEAVVKKIMAKEPRLRYEKLDKNSGGVGGPRNRAIKVARGDYIFFLDSDDDLPRHAMKAMYLAAHRDNSDIVVGETIRRNLTAKTEKRWLPYIFSQERRNISVLKYPEIIDDTLATNKLYKLDFLRKNKLYFEEGVHFEDIIFIAPTLVKAKSITIVPDDVYIWNIYDDATRKTITHQRDEIRSLTDRMYAIGKRNIAYDGLGIDEITRRNHVQFLKSHAMLYLMDASDYTDQHLEKVIKILKPVVDKMPPEYFDDLQPHNRVIYAMLLGDDVIGLKELAFYRKYGGRLTGKLHQESDRWYWISTASKGPSRTKKIRKLQDVTDSHIADMPVSTVMFYHQLLSVTRHGRYLELSGVTQDPLNKFNFSHDLTAKLLLKKRESKGIKYETTVEAKSNKGKIEWQARIKDFNFSVGNGFSAWSVFIKLDQGSASNESPIYIDKYSPARLAINSSNILRRILAIRLRLYRTVSGNVAFRHERGAGWREMPAKVYTRSSRYGCKLKRVWEKFVWHIVYKELIYRLFRLFPIDNKLIFFESQLGQIKTGSPKAIYDAISNDDRFKDYRFAWSNATTIHDPSNRTETVKRASLKYLWVLSRAKVIIDDQTLPTYFTKRGGQVYLETWHGIALKTLGLDEPKTKRNKAKSERIVKRCGQWDALLAPSKFFVDTVAKAFRFTGDIIGFGTPRNDVLVNARPGDITNIKANLDLPTGRKIVLYAPTFREAHRKKDYEYSIALNLDYWAKELGDQTYLLIKAHYLSKFKVPKSLAPYCMSVSNYPEMNDLYLIADCMITDYSSTMFDYATLERPMVFYAYDYDQYVNTERGTYFDLMKEAPGPVVFNNEDLYKAVKASLNSPEPSPKYRGFIKKYCGPEDGRATGRSVNYLAERLNV